jgi:hypothetical protein
VRVRPSAWLVWAALLAFLGGAVAFMLALERGSRLLLVIAIALVFVAMVLFLLAMWWPASHVDWDRLEAEQRLWESGPLGQAWLRVRRRLSKLWKI